MSERLISNNKPHIALDFDGVLNDYKGFDGDNLGRPRPGCKEFLEQLSNDYNVIIFSARNYTKIIPWLNKYNLQTYVHNVTAFKPTKVVCFIDDRGITFNGNYQETLEQIRNFKPYWE
jgi:phosphoglycolate phosphatase-like HAD superfamily hydrolase